MRKAALNRAILGAVAFEFAKTEDLACGYRRSASGLCNYVFNFG